MCSRAEDAGLVIPKAAGVMLQAYASRTGTRRNLEALGRAGWKLLCEPSQLSRYGAALPPLPYAIDNGAWGCYQREVPFDAISFQTMLDRMGAGADWIVVPDIVAGGHDSLRFSMSWLDRVSRYGLPLLAMQDGMVPEDVRRFVGPGVGIFLGGTTEWKLETMRSWGSLARRRRAHFHVARVNTARRIRLCQDAGADSFDGTSVSRFAVNLPRLDNERRQMHIFDVLNRD